MDFRELPDLASERATPLSHSFCQHAIVAREPLVVPDAREHPVLKTNPAIRDLAVIAYLGVPLISRRLSRGSNEERLVRR